MNKIIVPCIKVAQRHVWVRLLSIFRKVPKIKMAQLFFKYTRFFGKFCSLKFLKQLSHFLTSNVQLIDNGICFTLLQKLSFLWFFNASRSYMITFLTTKHAFKIVNLGIWACANDSKVLTKYWLQILDVAVKSVFFMNIWMHLEAESLLFYSKTPFQNLEFTYLGLRKRFKSVD